MEIEGKIIADIPLVTGVSKAGNNWQKKEWVLETLNDRFPKQVKFHVFGEKATQFRFEIGKVYTISFDLESREFNGRWYTDVSCYAMHESGDAAGQYQQGGFSQPAAAPQFGQPAAAPQFGQPMGTPDLGQENTDDLPF